MLLVVATKIKSVPISFFLVEAGHEQEVDHRRHRCHETEQ